MLEAAKHWFGKELYSRTTRLEDRFNDDYQAELKRARLWSKAQKGTAPLDKIAVIDAKVRAAYEAEKARLKHEVEVWSVGAEMDCTPKFDFGDFCRR